MLIRGVRVVAQHRDRCEPSPVDVYYLSLCHLQVFLFLPLSGTASGHRALTQVYSESCGLPYISHSPVSSRRYLRAVPLYQSMNVSREA